MNQTKLHIFQIINSLGYSIFKLYYLVMYNLYTKFVRFLELCKLFSNGLVTEKGNILGPDPVPRFSDLEVIALSMAAESEELLFLEESLHLPHSILGRIIHFVDRILLFYSRNFVAYSRNS